MNKVLLLILLINFSLEAQVQSNLVSRKDSIEYFGKMINDSFPNWVSYWKKQNYEFDTKNVFIQYDDYDWKLNLFLEPQSVKWMSDLEKRLILLSPDSTKYVKPCGFCYLVKNEKGEIINDGEHDGYLIIADLKKWKARKIYAWSMLTSPILDIKWIDNVSIIAVWEEVLHTFVRPNYIVFDLKRNVNIIFTNYVSCAPPGSKN